VKIYKQTVHDSRPRNKVPFIFPSDKVQNVKYCKTIAEQLDNICILQIIKLRAVVESTANRGHLCTGKKLSI
jgi:hypothetical protein